MKQTKHTGTMKKTILTAVIFFLLGGTLATLVLFDRIQNMYKAGYNSGKIDGGFEVIEFLKEGIQNDITNKNVVETEKYLPVKYKGISIVEIDGVKTVEIIGIE